MPEGRRRTERGSRVRGGFGRGISAALAAAALFLCASCESKAERPAPPAERQEAIYGISTSLPILWPESHDISAMLKPGVPEHWALTALRERGQVRPIDSLANEDGKLALPASAVLVLAQPYPFSPDEYVALDDWVRAGGRVLLFADPMLTFHSAFALGDRRRPQDIIKLDPILARWGLRLMRGDDDGDAHGETVDLDGLAMPVAIPGTFTLTAGSGCKLSHDGLIVQCKIGRGRVLAVADAALLEPDEHADADSESHRKVLLALLNRLESAR